MRMDWGVRCEWVGVTCSCPGGARAAAWRTCAGWRLRRRIRVGQRKDPPPILYPPRWPLHLAGHRRPPRQTQASNAPLRAVARFQPAPSAAVRLNGRGRKEGACVQEATKPCPRWDIRIQKLSPPFHVAQALGGQCGGNNVHCLLIPREHSRIQLQRRVERGRRWYPIHHQRAIRRPAIDIRM
jgi:hypothetical protein